jgi:hypothetical protein
MGTWWLTDRLLLDDDDEVAQLADALDLSTDDSGRLRNSLAMQLADVLYGAIDLPAGSGSAAGAVGADQDQQAAPAEPDLLARLREAEFVEYDVPSGDGDVVRLPDSGLRIVMVSGPEASVSPGDALMPVLTDLTSDDQPAPVVAVEPSRVPEDEADGDEPPAERLVDVIRDDGDLSQYVSTVDNLDRASGRVATVLALVDAEPGAPRIGHYGTEDGTQLLPPVPDAEDGDT